MEYTDEQLRAFAAQLSHPEGEMGIEVAQGMSLNNADMISKTIQSLQLIRGQQVLELGHGNGFHIPDLLTRAQGLHYTGLEISRLMHAEAQKLAQVAIGEGKADFHLYTGDVLPFGDGLFDQIMTVNTLYFWKEPLTTLREIHRVLKPGGRVYITYGQEAFMAPLPFTQYGFQLYDTSKLRTLLNQVTWKSIRFEDHRDRIELGPDDFLDREFTIAIAEK